jgi:hypothetical protein
MTIQSRTVEKKLFRTSIVVLVGIVTVSVIRWSLTSAPATLPQPEVDQRPTVQELVERNLGWADEQSAAELGTKLVPVREFFAEARRTGTRAFAEDALGWDSKWLLTKSYLFSGDEHERFLQERFSDRIFSAAQLSQLVELSVSAYLRHADDVESQMLVNLQADLANLSPGESAPSLDREAIQQSLDTAINEAIRAVDTDFQGAIGRDVASFIAGEVLGAATLGLATSTGILGTGAASGTVTMGVGLVVGIIVDYFVGVFYDWYFDPVGELSGHLNKKLTELEALILGGTCNKPGLEQQLQDYAQRRAQARSLAVKAAVAP